LLLSEAFCLYGERDIFKPYEKNHSTVKDVAQLAEEVHAKSLLLYHTEDTHIAERKALYTAEAAQYYHGSILVPDDLETISFD
jgi:Metal-dependent hydrolases of the beta-lactamase superfamily III